MTIYFCWKCKTKDHWHNESCIKDAATQEKKDPPPSVSPTPAIAAPIKKVQEFIKSVRGRPKVYPDRKTQMRELMRRKRETKLGSEKENTLK